MVSSSLERKTKPSSPGEGERQGEEESLSPYPSLALSRSPSFFLIELIYPVGLTFNSIPSRQPLSRP